MQCSILPNFGFFFLTNMKTVQDTHETTSLFDANKKLLFLFICLLAILLLYVKKSFIENETAAFEFLQDRPEGAVLRWISTLQFLSIPLIYLWKFTVIGFIIWLGCFTYGFRVTFSQCWGVVMVAEFIFFVPELIKIMWFLFAHKDPDLNDIRAFYPLSLMHFFDFFSIDPRYAYPLRALNLFEIPYCFLLVEGVHHFVRRKKRLVWIIIVSSYVLIFLLWLLFYVIVYD